MEYAVWFDETGMQIAVGHTVTDQILDKAFLSWEDVSGRIHQLLKQGEYAPQSVLDVARSNAVKEHAQTLAYMKVTWRKVWQSLFLMKKIYHILPAFIRRLRIIWKKKCRSRVACRFE